MKLLRPRSLSALVLAGLAIIVLPLIAALALAGLQMRQLSEDSRRIVANSVVTTRLNRDLFTLRADLDRRVKYFEVLKDPEGLKAYLTQDAKLADIERSLVALVPETQPP